MADLQYLNSAASDELYTNSETGAYFYPKKGPDEPDSKDLAGSHTIAIIGWDDNFAIENFK